LLAIRIPPDIEKRLDQLAKRTGRTKSFLCPARPSFATSRISRNFHLAERRLRREGARVTLEELEKELP